MAIAFVQAAGTVGTSVFNLAYGSSNTAGSLLIAVIRISNGTGAITVSDSLNPNWTSAVANVNGTSNDAIFFLPNCAAGANTVHVAQSGEGACEFLIAEYSGLALTSPLDKTASSLGTSATGSVGPTATTTVANELIIAGFSNESANGLTFTNGTGYTIRTNAQGNVVLEDQIVSAKAAYSASIGFGSSVQYSGLIATFKAPVLSGNPNSLMLLGLGT
jgi:hypothetical protein